MMLEADIMRSSQARIEAKECDLQPDNEISTTTTDSRQLARRRGRRRRRRRQLQLQLQESAPTNARHGSTIFTMSATAAMLPLLLLPLIIATTPRQAEAILSYSSTSSGQGNSQQQASIGNLQQSLAQLLQVFNGNESAPESNHFKLLERQGDFVLVGGR